MPTSKSAASSFPRLHHGTLLPSAPFSTISSILAGWIRPSTIRRSRQFCRYLCRLRPKPEDDCLQRIVNKFYPVSVSRFWILSPSRPMIRPFISSFGSCTTETVVSATWSAAQRWMAVTTLILGLLIGFLLGWHLHLLNEFGRVVFYILLHGFGRYSFALLRM